MKNTYLEKLADADAINGISFFTSKNFKQHIFDIGKIMRLDISRNLRWKEWITRWASWPWPDTRGWRHWHVGSCLLLPSKRPISKANDVETAKVQGLLSIVKALLSNTNTTPKRYTFFLTTSPAATPCSSQRPRPRSRPHSPSRCCAL